MQKGIIQFFGFAATLVLFFSKQDACRMQLILRVDKYLTQTHLKTPKLPFNDRLAGCAAVCRLISTIQGGTIF